MGLSGNREKTFIEYLLHVNTVHVFSHLVLTAHLRSWLNHPSHEQRDSEAQRGYLGDLAKEARVRAHICLFPKACALPTESWEACGPPGSVEEEDEAGRKTVT